MPTPYRRSSRHSLLFLAIVLIGIAVGVGSMAALTDENLGAWIILIGSLPIAVALVGGLLVLSRLDRRRIARVAQALQAVGFRTNTDPNDDAKAAALERFSHIVEWLGLQGGSSNVVWLAFLDTQGRQVVVFEHLYFTGSGKSTQEHIHTVVAMEAANRTEQGFSVAGSLILNRPRLGERRLLVRSSRLIELRDREFDRKWVSRGDPHTLASFANGRVRQALLHSPRGESWHVGGGWVCCGFAGSLGPQDIVRFIGWATEVLAFAEDGVG